MSFADLERGLGERAPLARELGVVDESEVEFKSLLRVLSIQIHKLSANVVGLNKLNELLGTKLDSIELRTKLHNLNEVTRELVKDSTIQLKSLASYTITTPQRKLERDKLTNDFHKSLKSFQQAQTKSIQLQRSNIQLAKQKLQQATPTLSASDTLKAQTGDLLELEPPRQIQAQETISDAEVEFQEQLIAEREGEIIEIEQGITELNEIFRDLATIVSDQGSMINNIESNVISVNDNSRNAVVELTTAHEYQRKSARRMTCLLLCFVAVITVVLLAVLS